MTAQATDMIILDGSESSLYEIPRDQWFEQTSKRPEFEANSSAPRRDYLATRESRDDRL